MKAANAMTFLVLLAPIVASAPEDRRVDPLDHLQHAQVAVTLAHQLADAWWTPCCDSAM